MMNDLPNRPLYSIGVVSELLEVHPETIRAWERSGVVRPPHRRSGKRLFSTNDLRRLQFVQRLAEEGLSLRAMLFYLKLYACWDTDECAECLNVSDGPGYTKPCWKIKDKYCKVTSNEDLCARCPAAQMAPDTAADEGDLEEAPGETTGVPSESDSGVGASRTEGWPDS